MIAKAPPGFYPTEGRRISQPHKKRHHYFNGRPMGLFLSQPLTVNCRTLDELHTFLAKCRYVSDREQFGVDDHWMPPEEFEKVRKGDCDDHALWTWRQLLSMGYDARYVVGRAGRYGHGHAWATYVEDGDTFVVEPTAAFMGKTFPRLSILRYRPSISVDVVQEKIRFFEHEARIAGPGFGAVVPLIPELVLFRLRWMGLWIVLGPRFFYRKFRAMLTPKGRNA